MIDRRWDRRMKRQAQNRLSKCDWLCYSLSMFCDAILGFAAGFWVRFAGRIRRIRGMFTNAGDGEGCTARLHPDARGGSVGRVGDELMGPWIVAAWSRGCRCSDRLPAPPRGCLQRHTPLTLPIPPLISPKTAGEPFWLRGLRRASSADDPLNLMRVMPSQGAAL
jgi:hypothetical protein